MTGGVIALILVLYLSSLAVGVWYVSRPKQKQPITEDELERKIASLRQRTVELEDNFERHLKRDAVRSHREKTSGELLFPETKEARLAALRARAAQLKLGGRQ